MRQDVTDYKLELKISVCMEFRISTEFKISIAKPQRICIFF